MDENGLTLNYLEENGLTLNHFIEPRQDNSDQGGPLSLKSTSNNKQFKQIVFSTQCEFHNNLFLSTVVYHFG
jgi:hypothetical protein